MSLPIVAPAPAPSEWSPVGSPPRWERVLPSGLRVVIEPGGAVPVAAVWLWIRAGASLEPVEQAGAAHLLEHLVFKGAGDRLGAALTDALEAVGGDLNAWTSLDQTAYTATVPLRALKLAVEVVADLAFRPHLKKRDLDQERGVVLEELRGAMDDPGSVLGDALRARLWGEHPYGRPVLGDVPRVKRLGIKQLRALHARHYRPEAATLVIAGPVDIAETLALVNEIPAIRNLPAYVGPRREGFAPWHSTPEHAGEDVAERKRLAENRPAAPGVLVIDRSFEDRHVEILFPAPGPIEPGHAAADVLSVALGSGVSALLSRELRLELDVALSAWSAMENDTDGATLVIGMSPREGRAVEAVAALGRLLGRVAAGELLAQDLRQARASIRHARIGEGETVGSRANRAGWTAVVLGELREEAAYEAALDRVTLGELRAAARQIIHPDRGVLGALIPASEAGEDEIRAAWLQGFAEGQTMAAGDARAVMRAMPCHMHLDNGLQIAVEPDQAATAGFCLVGVGGSMIEPRGAHGTAAAWSALVSRGAGNRDATDFAAAVEERAASFGGVTGRSTTSLSMRFPVEELDLALELLADVVLSPTFSPEELERVRKDLLEARRSTLDDPESVAAERAVGRLWPGHPWGYPDGGSEAGIGQISRRGVLGYHQRWLQGANLMLGCVGDVDPVRLKKRLQASLGRLPMGSAVPWGPPEQIGRPGRIRAKVPRAEATAALVICMPGVGIGHPEDAIAQVAMAVLGGAVGGGGRLFSALREERGLAYSVSAGVERGLGGGALTCMVSTDPGRVREARAAIHGELARLGREGVPAAEVERVKGGILDGAILSLQRPGSRADAMAFYGALEGPALRWRESNAAIAKVTAEQVQDFSRRWLLPERGVDSVAGPGGGEAERSSEVEVVPDTP